MAKPDEFAPSPDEVEAVLAEFGGDYRAAIAALLHDVAVLADDCQRAVTSISFGYSRGLRALRRR